MTLPIVPETLPRQAVALLEFIEWMEQYGLHLTHTRAFIAHPKERYKAVAEYLGLRLCPGCNELRPMKQFDSNDGKYNRTKCMRCSAPPRKRR